MQGRQKIEEAARSQKTRAIIAGGVGDVLATALHGHHEEEEAAARNTSQARPRNGCREWARPGMSHPARAMATARDSPGKRASFVDEVKCAPSFARFCKGSSMSLQSENSTQAAPEAPAESRR